MGTVDNGSGFLAHIPDAAIIVGEDQAIRYVNSSAEQMFGFGANEMLGRPLSILIPPESVQHHAGHFNRFLAGAQRAQYMNQRREVTGLRRDGRRFPAEASIVKTEFEEKPVVLALLRDVSERKRQQAIIEASERKNRAIIEGCPDAILIADAVTGRICETNEAAGRLFGCAAQDLIGLHQSELHPLDRKEYHRQTFYEHITRNRELVPDGEIRRSDGSCIPIEIKATPLVLDNKLMLVGFFRDASHRIKREAELVEALKSADAAAQTKTMFLANMSHELRTPLNSILGFAEMIELEMQGPHSNPKYKEYSTQIRKSGEHLLAIINDLLDVSALEVGKFRIFDEELGVAEIVNECRQVLLRLIADAEVEFVSNIEPTLKLRADRRAMKQMLINLFSNALKFTPLGGNIAVTAHASDDGHLHLAVADNGVGITPERIKEITQPFSSYGDVYSRSKGGTGLGLAITEKLAQLHGGSLRVESQPGVGTTVTLLFPLDRLVSN